MNKIIRILLISLASSLLVNPSTANGMLPSGNTITAGQEQETDKIVGIVLDSKTNEPLTGVTVLVQGTTRGVATDLDGKFELAASYGEILQISFVGYETKEIEIGNQKVISVTLTEDAKQLEEVVVSAYGSTQRRETVVGSIQSVRPSELSIPSASFSNSFAGRLAGVIAYQRSGEPGSNGSDFYIRGISTINGSANPLIILDGMEISSGDLDNLDPEIIESFSILKDATATAMYGTRGANGVMIIKTKSGADLEKAMIGVRVEAYANMPIRKPRFVSAEKYMRMYNEAVTNQGTGDVLYTDNDIYGTVNRLDPYIYPDVDWYDEIFKDASFNQKINFNIRGGSNRIVYFMNLTANHETGMLQNTSKDYYSYKNNINLWRYTFQNNIDFKMSKSSTIGLHLNVQLSDFHGPSTSTSDIYGAIMNANPVIFPIAFPNVENENWVRWGGLAGGNTQGVSNPMAVATQGYRDYFASTVTANIDWTQKLDVITPGLSFNAMVAFKNWARTTTSRSQGYNTYYMEGYERNGDGTYTYDISPISEPSRRTLTTTTTSEGDRRFYLQAYLNYERTFGDHTVSAMFHYDQDQLNYNQANTDLITSLPQRKMGIAGRLAYDYAHRYMLEVNAGYNGSDNFAEGHRWGFFPSVAAGWNISEEKFWAPLSRVIPRLKLRASYGLVGNDQIGSARYIYLAQVNLQGTGAFQTGYGTNTQSYSGPTYDRYENNDITWEVGHKLNVGMDLNLFHDFNLTIDAFQEVRDNIFQQRYSIPNYLGTANTVVYGNLAKVRNHGFEMALDYNKRINDDWSVMFKGTFTYARNKVLEYDEAPGARQALQTRGHRLYSIYGYVADGLYIDEADIAHNPTSTLGNIAIAPGDVKFVDQPDNNGEYDGRITSDDRVAIGHPTIPEIIYGFGPSIQFRKWDFSFYFQGQANVSLMMSNFSPFGAQYQRNVLQWIADDYWSAENQNPNAAYPRLTKFENNHNQASSTYWLRNAAFLKLKNLEFGYRFNKTARVYVSGINLLTFSPFKHWDPEMGGGAGLTYPTQRTFNVGLQMSF